MNIVNYYRESIKNIILDEFSLKNDDIKNISFEFPKENDLGATMRLGAYPCYIKKNSLASKVYRKKIVSERKS